MLVRRDDGKRVLVGILAQLVHQTLQRGLELVDQALEVAVLGDEPVALPSHVVQPVMEICDLGRAVGCIESISLAHSCGLADHL